MSQGKLPCRQKMQSCCEVSWCLACKETGDLNCSVVSRVVCCSLTTKRNLFLRTNRQARKRLYASQGLKRQKKRQRRKEDPFLETFQQASSHAELMGTPRRLETPERNVMVWPESSCFAAVCRCWGGVAFYRSRWRLGKPGCGC